MNKRGRPKGKSISTIDQESAVYAAYRTLRGKGFSHRNALSELYESKSGLDLNSIVQKFMYRPYHRCATLGISRMAAIVTQKKKVIAGMKDHLKLWQANFKALRKGQIEIITTNGPTDLLFTPTTKKVFSKEDWKEAVKSLSE